GLLLWLSWCSARFDTPVRTPATLAGTLRKADPSGPRHWRILAVLLGLLAFRAWIYGAIGPAVNWTPSLDLGFITLSFRGNQARFMLLFSFLSFGLALAVFYLWLLLLSLLNRRVPDSDPVQKLVRLHLGWVEPLPVLLKAFLPFLLGGLSWLALHPLLSRVSIIPAARSPAQLLEQAAFLGAAAYLAWKYLIVSILFLHLLNSYVFLGNHPVWNFVNTTARTLLLPLRWIPLRLGRIDFSPLVGMALVFLVGEAASRLPLTGLYKFLPF
ncbi:MAG TPA: hypothetical protein VH598_02615, partial [Verrucomicrobiae bacterium]|nr:hypothetical protein [Verrucomicrobiae bacterium]